MLGALGAAGLHPGDLLDPEALGASLPVAQERLSSLLERGLALALAVERWASVGLWVLGVCDPEYPARYRDRLGMQAPPLLYGAGDPGLLSAGGLAVVGSRNVSDEGLAFAERVGARCAAEEVVVISGGAKGVDAAAMQGCFLAGGRTVGLLADSLARPRGGRRVPARLWRRASSRCALPMRRRPASPWGRRWAATS